MKRFFYTFMIMAIFCMVLIVPIPRNISISADFIEWKNNDSSYVNSKQVSITGVYRKNLIGRASFYGDMFIEDITEKWDTELVYLPFLCELSNNDAPIFLRFDNTKGYTPQKGWTFVCSENFQMISILAPSTDPQELNAEEMVIWSPEDSIVFTYPATTRTEAVHITRDLFSDDHEIKIWN